jgi:hypothetical protein
MKANEVTMKTVRLVSRILKPWVDESIVGTCEHRQIVANLRHLAQRGTLLPAMTPKLLSQSETAEMLGISLSSFKKQEKAGDIRIPRRMLGTSVRYLNVKVLEYILADDEESQ